MSAFPTEVVDSKTGVEEPLVVHGVNVPASGPQNNVHLLPKEFDDKVAKMHLSALGAELVALIVDVSPAGTSPKAVCGASCERFCGESIQEVQGTMEVTQGQYIDRITDATVCCNTKYDPSEQYTSRQHRRRLRLSQRQSSMFQKDSRDPPSAVH